MMRSIVHCLILALSLSSFQATAVVVPESTVVTLAPQRQPLTLSGGIPIMAEFNATLGEFVICSFSVDPAFPGPPLLDCDYRNLDGSGAGGFELFMSTINGRLTAMTLSDSGNIYIAAINTNASDQVTLIALDRSGTPVFSNLDTGGGNPVDGLAVVLVDDALWLVYSTNNTIIVEVRDPQTGSITFGPEVIATGNACAVTAATNNNHDVAISWVARSAPMGSCNGDIMARVYRDNVTAISDVITLSNTTVSGSDSYALPRISASNTGLFTATWSDVFTGIFVSRFDAEGNLTLFSSELFSDGFLPNVTSTPNTTDFFVARNSAPGTQCTISGRLALAGESEPNVTFFMDECPNPATPTILFLPNDRVMLARIRPDFSGSQREIVFSFFHLPAEIALDGVSLAEGDPQLGQGPVAVADVTLTRPHPSGQQIDVSYFTRSGTALAGEDYGQVTGTVSFPAGTSQLGQSIQIPIIPDDIYEEDEVFTVNLSSPINAVIKTDNDSANIIILNDDAAPDLINNCQTGSTTCQAVDEPLPGNSLNLEIIFTIPEPQVRDITFNYTTEDGTAVAGADYIGNSGTAQIVAGSTQTAIILTILGDDLTEDTETFNLSLTAGDSVTISEPLLTFAIADDTLCFVEIDPLGHNVPLTGGSRSFNVTTPDGCAWSATSMVPWAAITSGASGSGAGVVDYTVEARNDTQVPARFGDIVVSISSPMSSVTHTVEQDGDPNFCQFTVTPATVDFSVTGGSASAAIETLVECGWEAFSDDAWLTIDAPLTPLFGNGTVSVTAAANVAAANVATAPRSSTLDAPFNLVVNQAGCSFDLPVTSTTVPAVGDDQLGAFILAPTSDPGPCPWTAVSNAAWILVIQGTSGSGGGEVVMDVLENPSVQPRTGTVQIGDDLFTVNQDGQSCDYMLQPDQVSVCPDGGTFNVDIFATAGCSWELSAGQSWLQATANGNGIGDETAILQNNANLSETPRSTTLSLQLPGSGAVQSTTTFNQDGFLIYEPFDTMRPTDWSYTPDSAWSVQNGRLLATLQDAGDGAAIDQSAQGACTDCKVEATVNLLTPGSTDMDVLMLVGWYQNDANFVGLAMNEFSNRWALLQMAGGNLSRVEAPVEQIIPNQDYHLAIRYDGSQFSADIDGTPLLQLPQQPASNPLGFAGLLVDNHNVALTELRLTGASENIEILLADSFEQLQTQGVSMCTQ